MRRKLITSTNRESLLVQEDKGEFLLHQTTNGSFPDLRSDHLTVLELREALELAHFILHR